MKEKLKEIKDNKVFKIVSKIVNTVIIIFLLLFAMAVYLQRFSNNKASFFNYRMFTVITGSMEPKYHVGDVLIAKHVDPSVIKEGDAISYEGKHGDFKDKIITHEVVKVEKDENGKYLFRAKGLSNLIEDPIVSEEQLYGKIVYKSIGLSFVYNIISSNIGFYLCIIVPLVFIIGYEAFTILLEREERKRNK